MTQDFSSRVVGPLRLRPHISRYPLLIIFIEKAQCKFEMLLLTTEIFLSVPREVRQQLSKIHGSNFDQSRLRKAILL